ncbi:hypothetical protein DL93DRAFT_2171561 [Clavulina sp. PMI_390]|nr:hypothetical protein DL93DRAFT_2171561 [Clavulina sp. PMI_390]
MYDPNAHGKENDAVVIPVYRTPRGKALIGIIAVCFFLMGGVVGGVVGGIVGHNKASNNNAFGGGISSGIPQSSYTTSSQSVGSAGSGRHTTSIFNTLTGGVGGGGGDSTSTSSSSLAVNTAIGGGGGRG